jgi:ATP-dependent DNA helicase RecQ
MSNRLAADAHALLQRALGEGARFREGQLEAVLALVEQRRRVLVVQRTGWGKSIVYFLATRLLRDRAVGPTVLISPLLSLIRDQLQAASALELRAASIDSTNPDTWVETENGLASDDLDLVLVSPERLGTERFQSVTVPAIERAIGLLVVDEAHCISDWGHDFRPDYQRIDRLVRRLPEGVPLLATTATANTRVQADVEEQLGSDLEVIRGALARDSLYLQVLELPDQAERLAWLADYLRNAHGAGIVYTLTTRDANRVSRWLATQGIDAPAYHAQIPDAVAQRPVLEERLRRNEVKALVSTVALGMGFDKPDLAFVVHFQRPGSVVFYYRQIGRAGRDIDRAEVVLLSGAEDDEIAEFFIETAVPPVEELLEVLAAIEEEDISPRALEGKVNLKRSSIERALKVLDLAGAIAKEGSMWYRTPNPFVPDHERSARVTAVRERERERIQDYVNTEDCLMAFLTRELDDPQSARCGRCANCAGPFAPSAADHDLAQEARIFLRRAYRPIVPGRCGPPAWRRCTGVFPRINCSARAVHSASMGMLAGVSSSRPVSMVGTTSTTHSLRPLQRCLTNGSLSQRRSG